MNGKPVVLHLVRREDFFGFVSHLYGLIKGGRVRLLEVFVDLRGKDSFIENCGKLREALKRAGASGNNYWKPDTQPEQWCAEKLANLDRNIEELELAMSLFGNPDYEGYYGEFNVLGVVNFAVEYSDDPCAVLESLLSRLRGEGLGRLVEVVERALRRDEKDLSISVYDNGWWLTVDNMDEKGSSLEILCDGARGVTVFAYGVDWVIRNCLIENS